MHKFNNPSPFLKTERLVLKKIALENADEMLDYRSNSDVQRYQSFKPVNKEQVVEFIKTNSTHFNQEEAWYQLGVFENEKMIGDIGIHFIGPENKQCEIGYTISHRHQRKGYGKEAVTGLITYLFKTLGKHRIIASLDPNNTASVKLLESIGFRKEGLFMKSVLIGNKWEDELVYALLDKEWNK